MHQLFNELKKLSFDEVGSLTKKKTANGQHACVYSMAG